MEELNCDDCGTRVGWIDPMAGPRYVQCDNCRECAIESGSEIFEENDDE